MAASAPSVVLRFPKATAASSPGSVKQPTEGRPFTSPTVEWLTGTWHVTHSTLPMWKSKRNVAITYNPEAGTNKSTKLEDVVSYQTLSSDKIKTVVGIDTISPDGDTGAWDWRGKGWLMIASSHWEILGWGNVDLSQDSGEARETETAEGGEAIRWALTYFSKTTFTPAGIDIYCQKKHGINEVLLAEITKTLTAMQDPTLSKLAGELFQVKHD